MTLLPIVGRELRVASRKRGTYWSRVVAALVVLVVILGTFLINTASRGAFRGQLGPLLFQTTSWMCFAFVCAAGMFLTADCLSEEKRDGTLGLLFLTDLRGMDVVFGKLLANSLRGTYGLLAVFPMVGLSFLLGGLSGVEFWRLTIVLCNTLFFTICIGVFVSAISRESPRAMFGTLAVCLFFLGVTWLIDWTLAGWETKRFVQRLTLASPVNAFLQLNRVRYDSFWKCTAVIHGLAWVFLIAACVAAPRSWQEKIEKEKSRRRNRGGGERSRAWRSRLLEINPVRWLAAHRLWRARGVQAAWLLMIPIGPMIGWAYDWQVGIQTAQIEGLVLSLFLALTVASQCSRFFVEATQSGALELILSTPLPAAQIVRGMWATAWRALVIPMLSVLAVHLFGQITQLIQYRSPPVASSGAQVVYRDDFLIYQYIALVQGTVTFFMRSGAAAWFAMWMGVITRKANAAVFKTLVFVYVLPWFGFAFLQGLIFSIVAVRFSGPGAGSIPFWIPQFIIGILSIGIDVMFIILARQKLMVKFRQTVERAAGWTTSRRVVSPVPPPLPASA